MKIIIKKPEVLVLVFTILLNSAIAQPKNITVKGNVKFNDPTSKIEIYKIKANEKIVIVESGLDADNNYKIDFRVDKPGLYYIGCKNWDKVSFWAEDENIEVNFRGVDTSKIKSKETPFIYVKGGPKNEVINQMNYTFFHNNQLRNSFIKDFNSKEFANKQDKEKAISLSGSVLTDDVKSRIAFFAELYSDRTSVIALLAQLSNTNYERNKVLVDKIVNKLNILYPGYTPLKDYINERDSIIKVRNSAAIGAVASPFSYPGLDGKLLGIKNFKGKILVVDFWASWCKPCRAEIPHLKEYYDIFKDKNVEFLSVSIDKSKDDWIKALEQEKMPWPQVLAPDAGAEVRQLYQFSMIPFIILIDSDGKISEKNLRGNALKAAIEDLIKK